MNSDRRGSSGDRGDPCVLHHVVGVVRVADEAESEGLHPADVLEKQLRIEMSWVVLHASFRLGERAERAGEASASRPFNSIVPRAVEKDSSFSGP